MPIRSAAQTHPAALVVALSLALLPAAPRAAAQGTFSLLPDPITSLDLIRYAERLALSPDQRLTAEAAHDEYKRHFKALRDGEIEELLKSRATLQSGGVMAAERGRQAVLDELDRLRRRIRSLDDSFFGGLDGALIDEQRLTLARLRLLRERCRYASNQFISTNHPVTDLGEIVWQIQPPAEELAEVLPILAPYEQELTARMKEMHEAAGRADRNVMAVFRELGMEGMTDEQMRDPEVMERYREAWRQRWAERGEAVREVSAG